MVQPKPTLRALELMQELLSLQEKDCLGFATAEKPKMECILQKGAAGLLVALLLTQP